MAQYFFSEPYYLAAKVAQLRSIEYKDANGNDYTEATVKEAFAAWAGVPYSAEVARQHYEAYGRSEGLNPNAYFNETEYLANKAKQLNSIKFDGRGDWTPEQVLKAITDGNMIPAEHYERWGCFETFADGSYLNPSNSVSTESLWEAKLANLQAEQPENNWTLETMLASYQASGHSVFDTGYIPDPDTVGKIITVDSVIEGDVEGTASDDVITVTETGVVTGSVSGINGDDVITIAGTAEWVSGGWGNSRITIERTGVVGGVRGCSNEAGNGDDIITVHGTVNGGVDGYGGNDRITVSKTGFVSDTVYSGGRGSTVITIAGAANRIESGLGNDVITINASAEIHDSIYGGAGADRITLREAGITVVQNAKGSGEFSRALVNASGVVSTTDFDVVDTGGLSMQLGVDLWRFVNFGGKFHKVATAAEISAAAGAAYWLQGTYANGKFTADAAGKDGLLVYDTGDGTKVRMEGLVALGVTGIVAFEDNFYLNDDFIPGADIKGKTITVDSEVVGYVDGSHYNDTITVTQTGSTTSPIDPWYYGIRSFEGDDVITVAGTVSAINGGSGNNTITIERTGVVTDALEVGNGNNTIIIHGKVDLAHNNSVRSGDGDNVITVSKTGYANHIGSGGGNDVITIDGTVGGIFTYGSGKNTITINGTAGSVSGSDGDDVITVSETGVVEWSISGGNGNDAITVNGTAGYVHCDSGDDVVTINAGAKVLYDIESGTGLDRIILREAGVTVTQWTGDSGEFSGGLVDETGAVNTSAFDVVDTGGLAVLLKTITYTGTRYAIRPATWTGGVHEKATVAEIGAADDTAYWVRGTGSDGKFSADAAGKDVLLVYDTGYGTAVQMEAMVLLGVSSIGVDGEVITLNQAG